MAKFFLVLGLMTGILAFAYYLAPPVMQATIDQGTKDTWKDIRATIYPGTAFIYELFGESHNEALKDADNFDKAIGGGDLEHRRPSERSTSSQ